MNKKESTASTTQSSDAEGAEKEATAELADMKRLLLDAKVDGNKSIWSMTLETFGMADGKHKKDDIIVDDVSAGLELLNQYVTSKQATMDSTALMDLVPLSEFNASQDQFLMAFLKWAEKEDPKKKATQVNVSKARRRLDAYFEWMEQNKSDFEQPLTLESIMPVAKVWDIQITYDTEGHFLWWIDLGSMDKAAVANFEPRDHLRYVVWFAHLVMLDKKAQDNGAIIIEDMGMVGFWKLATLVPHELSAKMDRLTIGILPVRMKKIYIFGAARWMSLLIGMMKPFMGKKMRDRMKILSKKTDVQQFCDDLVKSRKNIPAGFCGIQGEAPRDEHFKTHNQR